MDLQITGKNIDLTPELRKYIERKLSKLDRHLPGQLIAKVEISEEKTRSPLQRFIAQVTLDSGGTLLRAEDRGEELFSAVDRTVEIMDRQIERFKGKRNRGKGGTSPRTEQILETAGGGQTPAVVKVKQFAIKHMPVDEAIEQMELLGHDFFLFLHKDSGKLNLLYRRMDKNYGIIEPKDG
jgi:putative sigma-54 modulation protein